MKESRIIGRNVQLHMKKNGISRKQMAESLAMSELDIQRVLSNRLLLSGAELKEVAEVLCVSPNDLLQSKSNEEYKELIHCMGEIDSLDNVERVLDFIDTYISLVEDYYNKD